VTEFLVVYNYGMGGVWGFATAETAADIACSFPELNVVADTPPWMANDQQSVIRANSIFVVDQPNTYPEWLRVLIAERPPADAGKR